DPSRLISRSTLDCLQTGRRLRVEKETLAARVPAVSCRCRKLSRPLRAVVGYAIFNFIGGWASDQLGGKRVFALAMGVWSTFCALTAAATGFVSLLVIRVFFGVGEGPLSSTMNKVVNNWFPHREAASAV